jgi:hypothetical protein
MPSPEYYRRQADTLLAIAVNTSDPELSTRCRNLAIAYKLLEGKAAADDRVTTDPVTLARPAGEAKAD